MYNRNQLILAQKQVNESGVDLLKDRSKTDIDTAIDQIDYLLSFINNKN